MGAYTHYLAVSQLAPERFRVALTATHPLASHLTPGARDLLDLRYSPILPAFLLPDTFPPTPTAPTSISFYFPPRPYFALGQLKLELTEDERDRTYFTQGLASVLLIDMDLPRARRLLSTFPTPQFEHWTITNGEVHLRDIVSEQSVAPSPDLPPTSFRTTTFAELDVYLEQATASLSTLWHFYGIHNPGERGTVRALATLLHNLVDRYINPGTSDPQTAARRRNATISALVELTAALSYSTTQGCSGSSPILGSRSPFPHNSLLGVGGAVRALTKFTRYLERAFSSRSAAQVITKEYPHRTHVIPRIAAFDSGPQFQPTSSPPPFDNGGHLAETVTPLLAQFSLRHGFKESKFSITAASESLSVETLPQWTLMTLSHEIMHSRVRDIFQAVFGTTWDSSEPFGAWETFYTKFAAWYFQADTPIPVDEALRNVVLNFCCAMMRSRTSQPTARTAAEKEIPGPGELFKHYLDHKRLAVELFVHFHDYYFAYAGQPKPYAMSLWASWPRVAAPFLRPLEYLVRTLATLAAGTGLVSRAAYRSACEQLTEALETLEARGLNSPLYDELRRLLTQDSENVFAQFKPAYYLADHVRLFFSSRTIAEKIDTITTDPFAEGSTDAEDYSSNIYALGNPHSTEAVSPVRFSLAGLVGELTGKPLLDDTQWLTAWNGLVIASQEVGP